MATLNATVESNARKAEQAVLSYLKSSVRWNWPGAARTVKGDLRDEIAGCVESDRRSTRTTTDLYNWALPVLSRVRSFRRSVGLWWESVSLGWVEDGTRLLPKAEVERFEARMADAREELARLASEVQAQHDEIIAEARARRGKAFDEADYPADLSALFGLSWSYDALTVSKELREISQGAYAAEQARQTMRVLGAVQLAEEAKMRELREMVARLADRLAPGEGGKRKAIHETAVEDIREFCATFSGVVLWGCDDIAEVVEEANWAIAGIDAEELRKSAVLRRDVSEQLAKVARMLEALGADAEAEQAAA